MTFPNPVLIDFEEGYLTAEVEGYDIPVLQPKVESDLLKILEAPHIVQKEIQEAGFPGYEVKTWIYDSASSMEDWLLGEPARPVTGDLPAKPGKGIMATARRRQNNEPSIEDYRELRSKMLGFFNMVRQMPYHTVITAHAQIREDEASPKGLGANPNEQTSMGLPSLTGRLKYHADNLVDLFLYCESRRVSNRMEYKAWPIPHGMWHARTRIASKLTDPIVDPSFEKILAAYEAAKEGSIELQNS